MTCIFRDKNALYWDIPPGHTDSLKLDFFVSTNDNMFTVTNSLGMFTVLVICRNYLWPMWL